MHIHSSKVQDKQNVNINKTVTEVCTPLFVPTVYSKDLMKCFDPITVLMKSQA